MPAFFCAGEPSGDLYAGLFIRELKKQFPDARILGVGNGQMRDSGAEIIFEYTRLMSLGLKDSVMSACHNYSAYRNIARWLCRLRPRVFVAIAYPGMNLLLCRYAKKIGVRVYYLMPPQIWAWGKFRKFFVRKWVDSVVSVFPFEAEFYRGLGIETIEIENPLVSKLSVYKRNDHHKRIGFMPGSRPSHVRRNMPVVLELTDLVYGHIADVECCLIAYDSRQANDFKKDVKDGVRVVHENRYQVMKNCDLLVIGSGTASLEAALLGVPQVFFNRPSFLDFHILRRFVRISEYNLANIYFGKKVVPSYVGYGRARLVNSICEVITNTVKLEKNKPYGTRGSPMFTKEVQ